MSPFNGFAFTCPTCGWCTEDARVEGHICRGVQVCYPKPTHQAPAPSTDKENR